ncbi:hypothetical protein KQ939_01960 [Planococcus sp. CP5-4]|nr:hypothetical protein [Planococcus sp. CP5-4_YE]MBU9673163.1 hypothetical protein [Planococcus sp. CP5-4_YE]MBW6062471.1 hypothetical protein [Planococcus sp. CP5-4]
MSIGIPIALLALAGSNGFYKRFVTAKGVKHDCADNVKENGDILLLDVRAYNISYKDPIEGAFELPVAYFIRGYEEIKDSPIHIIASDKMEKNMAVRLLRKKDKNVISYSLTEENCGERMIAK